ncbi:RNA-binding protein [Tissierella pigra]|uniref:RNA-binding protein n=1 Tax=Tissierella pigra TaxID=2607614 RepID=A0A6N7XWC2_9FIRM|nr:YlmH/Sll1252 family protein [Tissierella pigra]MBU5426463.1 RNA-binding protein [Tissierella pigra]MSU00090.1 RNA-binding protein [Tissierella pigra]
MKIDREKYTSHIKDNDKLIEMRRIIDKIEVVLNNHSFESTDFLDPYERLLAKSILNRFMEVNYLENGGIIQAERQILTIYPDYYSELDAPHDIKYLRINVDTEGLSHKDFLGSILNLGIKRRKIGDILVHEGYGDIIIKQEISNFILFNLNRIKNRKVIVEEKSLDSISFIEPEYKEINKVISSYRLDAYISSSYNLSRQESIDIIKSGNVKVNWESIDKASKEITVGDIVSVRGYGRSILYSVEGISKKGKIKATIRILI